MISKLKRIFLLKKKELQGIYNFKNILIGQKSTSSAIHFTTSFHGREVLNFLC